MRHAKPSFRFFCAIALGSLWLAGAATYARAEELLPASPCAPGDPLCDVGGFQTPQQARTSSVGTLRAGGSKRAVPRSGIAEQNAERSQADGSKPSKTDDTAARLRKAKRDQIKTTAPNPEKAPKPKPKSASRKNPARPDGILDKVDESGNWTYVFGEDKMSGDRLGACISARAKPWHAEPQQMGCIAAILALDDKFKATLQADSPDDHDAPPEELANLHAENEQQLKDTYLQTLTCLNPCLKQSSGTNDAQVLFECIDWNKIRETWKKGDLSASTGADGGDQPALTANALFEEKSPYACADDALLRATREGRYHGWGRDPKTGECVRCAKPGWHWSETEKHCVICEKSEHWDTKNLRCVSCPPDTLWDARFNACVHCTNAGEHWSKAEKRCVSCEAGKHWDEKAEYCVSDTPTDLGVKLQKEFERTHECTKDPEDLARIRVLAEKMIREGYPAAQVPPGGAYGRSCGYNTDFARWFNISFYCADTLTCYNQDASSLPRDCVKFTRKSPTDPLFILEKDCMGDTSYRYGGIMSDMRLIPIASKVWIQIFERQGRFIFVGYVFSE